MAFQGKVAVVTGGSRGIGRAIALELARHGAEIVVNYFRHHQEARDVAEEVRALGVRCLPVRAHLGDETQISKLFAAVEEEFGRMDILVNNAASGVQRSALDLEAKHWDWTLDINTKAPWLCTREAVRLMDKGGSVVNITSMGSQRVLPYYTAVGVSKAALEALTRYLAVELAPRGISVNAVAGGYVDTASLRQFPNSEEMLAAARDKTPAGRIVAPEDIAAAVAFLCSPQAEMIRGQIIVVDGGMTLLS
jgi:enoyl-[acyl-carrier protein] reductase III